MSEFESSSSSINQATRSKAKQSSYGGAGASGVTKRQKHEGETNLSTLLEKPDAGFGNIRIGLAWNNQIRVKSEGLLARFTKKEEKVNVDLDLGCLYQLKGDSRGCLQAFGELYGSYDKAPYIHHHGDERTGDTEGDDEVMEINGTHWDDIERILIYTYIYRGPKIWSQIMPAISLQIGEDAPVTYEPSIFVENAPMCGFVLLENRDGDMKLTQINEYYAGHAEISRAFGFGIRWEEGSKK